MDLDHWLERIGLGPYAPLFKSNDIDSELLGRLTDADLKDIGVASLGHRKKLLEAISALPTAAVAVAGEPRPTLGVEAGPERYIPRYLVEKILLSKAALEGERKHVTVLFADLRGSMELLADRDPEEARRILDPVLEAMMDAVHEIGRAHV